MPACLSYVCCTSCCMVPLAAWSSLFVRRCVMCVCVVCRLEEFCLAAGTAAVYCLMTIAVMNWIKVTTQHDMHTRCGSRDSCDSADDIMYMSCRRSFVRSVAYHATPCIVWSASSSQPSSSTHSSHPHSTRQPHRHTCIAHGICSSTCCI